MSHLLCQAAALSRSTTRFSSMLLENKLAVNKLAVHVGETGRVPGREWLRLYHIWFPFIKLRGKLVRLPVDPFIG